MPILSGDVKLVESQNMDDVPEGGGPPTAIVVPDGDSNNIFPDISESDRSRGRVRVRKLHASVQTPDRDLYLGANVIVSRPPEDTNVTISLFKAASTFDRRAAAAAQIENYLVRGPLFSGYLLERHVAGQAVIQVLQRVGAVPPTVGRTLVLVLREGEPDEISQAIRTTRVSTETRMFTEIIGSEALDFEAQIVTCELSDKLRTDFPGSPATRLFAAQPEKTILRDTSVANAGSYYGVSPLAFAATNGDTTARVQSVYTQLVPSARSESAAVDQRPAAQRTLTLATSPRAVEVGVAAHSMRDKVSQENRSFNWVAMLKPLPAPGTVVISFRALGNWYTVFDDGEGALTGAGASGTVDYLTGSVLVTVPSLPDAGSTFVYQWGEKTAFTDRSGTATFRAPEFALQLEHDNLKPGTVSITWMSGGVLKTSTGNAGGVLSGHAVGEVNHAAGMLFIRPTAMIDAGGEFNIDYQQATTITKSVTATPDAGGFATIALDDVPVAGSVTVRWATVRNVSKSSGATSGGTAAGKAAGINISTVYGPDSGYRPPVKLTRTPVTGTSIAPAMFPGGTRLLTGEAVYMRVLATYDAEGYYYPVPDITGVTWNETEFDATGGFSATGGGYKNIGGASYMRWGYSGYVPTPPGGLTSAP